MSSGRKKHTDKSSKSTKETHREAVSHPAASKPKEESSMSIKAIAIFAQLSLIKDDMLKNFSAEYTVGQKNNAQSLKALLNEKFKNNLDKIYVGVAKSLAAPILSEPVKDRLRETLEVITSVVTKKDISDRVNSLIKKVEDLLKHQQVVAGLQVDVASLSESCSEKEKLPKAVSLSLDDIANKLSDLSIALDEYSKILTLINDINKCLNPSAYSATSPAMHTAQPAQPKSSVKPEAITATGPGKGGKG